MNKVVFLIFYTLISITLLNAQNNGFDFKKFKNEFDNSKSVKSIPWFDFWTSEKDSSSKKESYSKRKYGREIIHKTYEEIKADRKRRNSILSIGSSFDQYETKDTYYVLNTVAIPSVKTGVIREIISSQEDRFSTTLDLRTLIDLKYFNIQQEVKDTYLGVTLGNYMDIDVSKDFFNGRETDFYFLVGPMMRVDLKAKDEMISFGLKSSLGYFFTEQIGIFYSLSYSKSEISSYSTSTYDSITTKSGLSQFAEQTIYISAKF